jgi:hypothetical protein
MLKEFVDTVKLHKEYVLFTGGLVIAVSFVMNYFATREALDGAQKKLDALITQRECELSNRIAVAELTLVISRLDRERLETASQRKELVATHREAPPRVKPVLQEQITALESKIKELGEEIAVEKKAAAQARDVLKGRECASKRTARLAGRDLS